MKLNGQYVVEKIWVVFYGRKPTIFSQCQICNSRYFQPSVEDSYNRVFCEECTSKSEKMNIAELLTFDSVKTRVIVGWESRIESSRNRSNFNFRKVLKRDGFICQYCGYNPRYYVNLIPLHVDHIIPFSYGGNNSMNNLVCACRQCNNYANDRVFNDFLDKKTYIKEKRRQAGLPFGNEEWLQLAKQLSN